MIDTLNTMKGLDLISFSMPKDCSSLHFIDAVPAVGILYGTHEISLQTVQQMFGQIDGFAAAWTPLYFGQVNQATSNDADDEQGNRNEDTSNPKPSVAGSCKCCKKNNFASRQFDRSPIKKYETCSQTTATQLRKEFLELGSLIKSSRTNQNLFAISDGQNVINSAYERVYRLILSDKGELAQVLSLVLVCGQPNLLVDIFGVRKTHRLLQYTGELLRQLAGSNSVLTLLKPWAIRDCLSRKNEHWYCVLRQRN
jgi:hypothetical protein